MDGGIKRMGAERMTLVSAVKVTACIYQDRIMFRLFNYILQHVREYHKTLEYFKIKLYNRTVHWMVNSEICIIYQRAGKLEE